MLATSEELELARRAVAIGICRHYWLWGDVSSRCACDKEAFGRCELPLLKIVFIYRESC